MDSGAASFEGTNNDDSSVKYVVALQVDIINSWVTTAFLLCTTALITGGLIAHLVAAWSASGMNRHGSRRTLGHFPTRLPTMQQLARALVSVSLFGSKLVDAIE